MDEVEYLKALIKALRKQRVLRKRVSKRRKPMSMGEFRRVITENTAYGTKRGFY